MYTAVAEAGRAQLMLSWHVTADTQPPVTGKRCVSNACILDNAWQLHHALHLNDDISEGLACLLW